MGVKQPLKTGGLEKQNIGEHRDLSQKNRIYLEVQFVSKIGDLYEALGLKQQFGIQPAEKVTKSYKINRQSTGNMTIYDHI